MLAILLFDWLKLAIILRKGLEVKMFAIHLVPFRFYLLYTLSLSFLHRL